ncbi:MAG: DUF427 domain-containing protein [Thermostichales cyanobacterium SZTDM-1c_bins_54]
MRPQPLPIQPGQESVWDYPRPPRCEPTDRPIAIHWQGQLVAATRRAYRVLETSHPPVYYLPPEDVNQNLLIPSRRRSWCEYKGVAHYWSLQLGSHLLPDVAWSYPDPSPAFAAIRNYLAFYAGPLDRVTVSGEQVIPQPGGFYGGWITSWIVGPFKGIPGSQSW